MFGANIQNFTDMETEKKDGWGGRRKGAGRKRTMDGRYAFSAPADIVEILDRAASKTDLIRDALRFYAAHGGQEFKNHLID